MFAGVNGGARMRQGHLLRKTGHPLLALGLAALGGAQWIANKLAQRVDYKCPICGNTKTQTEST